MNLLKRTGLGVALATPLLLAGCFSPDDGDNGTEPINEQPLVSAAFSGSVGDGPIVGATVTITDVNGAQLSSTTSDASANYNISLKARGNQYPLTITAHGGTDLVTQAPPDFALASAATSPSIKTVNLNPHGTLITELAAAMPDGLTTRNMDAARAIVVERLNFGLDTQVIPDPILTPVTGSNIHVMVKSSEALGEMIRRVETQLAGYGTTTAETIIAALAADLVSGHLDGSGADPHIAAVANIAAGQVALEALSNGLRVGGEDAAAAMDAAIAAVMPRAGPDAVTGNVPITEAMILQARLAVNAARTIAPDPALDQLADTLAQLQPGMLPAQVAATVPPTRSALLDGALALVAAGDPGQLEQVNSIVREQRTTPPATENTPPTISGTPVTEVAAGSAYTFTPTAADADGDSLTFTITNKPAWASFNSNSGALTGTPTEDDIGTWGGIVISVTDGIATVALAPFDLTVVSSGTAPGEATLMVSPNADLSNAIPLDGARIGGHVHIFFDPAADWAERGVDRVVYYVGKNETDSHTLYPPVSEAPYVIEVDLYQYEVNSTREVYVDVFFEGESRPDFYRVYFTVEAKNRPPVISGTPATEVVAGRHYQFTPTAHDPDGDALTFSITNKPGWATFNTTTGTLAGTPTEAHEGTTRDVTIKVSDGVESATLAPFDLTVTSAAPAPGVATIMVTPQADLSNAIMLDGATLGGDVHIFFQEGGDWESRGVERVVFYVGKDATTAHTRYPDVTSPPYAIRVDLTQYSAGSTREVYADVFFSGHSSPESFRVYFTVASSSSSADVPVNHAPKISGQPVDSVIAGQSYTFTPTASDADGDSLTFSISNRPTWASFDTKSGRLSGTPTSNHIGTYSNIVISVSDGKTVSSLPAFNLTVRPLDTAVILWTAPAERTDGTPLSLSELQGYRIYRGSSTSNLSLLTDIKDGTATSYTVTNLSSGTHYFAVTVYTADGAESAQSNIVGKTIP